LITPFTINVKQGLNKYYLNERVLVEPSNSIYCQTNDSYLLNFLFINKNETNNYQINKTISSSDLLILNETFLYEVDQNNILMFSFKVQVDYFNFTDIIKLNKIYLIPGFYDISINYIDPSNNLRNFIKLNVTTSKF